MERRGKAEVAAVVTTLTNFLYLFPSTKWVGLTHTRGGYSFLIDVDKLAHKSDFMLTLDMNHESMTKHNFWLLLWCCTCRCCGRRWRFKHETNSWRGKIRYSSIVMVKIMDVNASKCLAFRTFNTIIDSRSDILVLSQYGVRITPQKKEVRKFCDTLSYAYSSPLYDEQVDTIFIFPIRGIFRDRIKKDQWLKSLFRASAMVCLRHRLRLEN